QLRKSWRRELDSNQRYGFPYCLARSQPPKIHFETNPLRLREKHTLMSLPYRLFATPVQPKISLDSIRRTFAAFIFAHALDNIAEGRDKTARRAHGPQPAK